jgi:hypothetical protein
MRYQGYGHSVPHEEDMKMDELLSVLKEMRDILSAIREEIVKNSSDEVEKRWKEDHGA